MFLKVLDQKVPFRYLALLRQEIAQADPGLREKLVQVLEHLESWAENLAHQREALYRRLFALGSLEDLVNDRKMQNRLRDEYLAIIRNGEENIHLRFEAGQVMARVVREGVARSWASSLVKLLRDRDPTVQIIGVGAVIADVQGDKVAKSQLVRPLVQGLRHSRFSVRYMAQRMLEQIAGRQTCLDPSDPLDAREPAIREWEAWWQGNRHRLAKETLR
jgi:hypothetical protein